MSARARSGSLGEIGAALAAAWLCACSTEATLRLLQPSPGGGDAGGDQLPPPAAPADAAIADAAPALDAALAGDPLVLRYDFEGTGTAVFDRVDTAHARLMGGATLDGAGGVVLDGIDDYVDLPNGVLSRHGSVTVVAWLDWRGGVCWQRIFDFGSNDRAEGEVGNGLTSLYLTAANCIDGSYFASVELPTERHDVSAGVRLPEDRPVQTALRFDAATETLAIFVDGTRVGQAAAPFQLSEIDDVNAWLGQSQWIQDRNLAARYDELRIYDRALSDDELAALHARGPDLP